MRKRVLFVDDESKILDGIRRMMHAERERWDMEFAIGGQAALRACEAGSFDVVVSDMRMPGMDGATLLGLIRDLYPETARIVLSGYSETELSLRAIPVAQRFLAKPCSASELQSTIEQVCALKELLNKPAIRGIVGSVGQLPSLSSTYTSLEKALIDPEVSMNEVAGIIEEDVGMSAKVLQLVNSAFFGLGRSVTSVPNAAAYLGLDTIKNLALGSEVFRIFVPDKRISQSVCESIQKCANRAAAIASGLPMGPKLREVAVVAALLHDAGSLVLASKMPDEFCAAHSIAAQRGCKVFEAEEELLGTSHAEIGAYLLGLWGLRHQAVEAIAHHHRPTRVAHSDFDCTVAVYVASLLAEKFEADPTGAKGLEIEESDRVCLEKLGILSQFPAFGGGIRIEA
jgi:HD-like signal output (HDOD) protein